MVTPRSHCGACQRTIAWFDNVPVLSYLLLRGRCRHCGAPYSWRYPAVEAATGLLFFWSVYSRGPNVLGVKLCIFSAILVGLIVTDFTDRILPDEFTYGGCLAGLGLALIAPPMSGLAVLFAPTTWPQWGVNLLEAAIGAGVSAGLLWLVGEVYRRVRGRDGLGLGDIKMLLAIGAFLGLPGALMTVFLGSITGALLGGVYIWLKKHDALYELPFGSFLGAAALFVALFGEHLSTWYWGLGA